MNITWDFIVGLLIGLIVYRQAEAVILKKIRDWIINRKREKAQELLVAMDEYRRIASRYGPKKNR